MTCFPAAGPRDASRRGGAAEAGQPTARAGSGLFTYERIAETVPWCVLLALGGLPGLVVFETGGVVDRCPPSSQRLVANRRHLRGLGVRAGVHRVRDAC